MRVRRCSALFLELREDVQFDLDSLMSGGTGLARSLRWLAIAPHLDGQIEISASDRELLGTIGPRVWTEATSFEALESGQLDRLLKAGLLICDDSRFAAHRNRDDALRVRNWWAVAALFHQQGRWHAVDGVKVMEDNGLGTAKGLRERFGAPPAHVLERSGLHDRTSLPLQSGSEFDALLTRRATCRNFESRPLKKELFALILQRVFYAQAQVQVSDDMVFLKKTSPSGGGLHATEAYLIVQNVQGVDPGLYHYHPVDHALESLQGPDTSLADFAKLALAGQYWFANAPVLVVLAPRFARSFWKYRHHAKAYRALILDSGHLSQTLYLSATDLGLGAFVTSAINEVDIELAFGMDPLEESPLAICGFGWRAERMETTEFDPAGEVWGPVD